jgi:hypothetical protein
MSPAGLAAIRQIADAETDGNLSEMIRILLMEAIAARQSKARSSATSRTNRAAKTKARVREST